MLFRRWIKKSQAGKSFPVRRVRPFLETLEDRIALANYTWRGVANGLWSGRTNWLPNGVPGAADSAVFDATNVNDSKMDLEGPVGKLQIKGYTGTIKLQQILKLDVLDMSSGTITLDAGFAQDQNVIWHLKVDQAADSSIFGASSWTGGDIGGGSKLRFTIAGTTDHPLTFNLGSKTGTPKFTGSQWMIGTAPAKDLNTQVNWNDGNFTMGPNPNYVCTIRVCPIRGVSLLCDTETRIDPFGGTAD
jgi:hypothetical protein